MNIEATSGTGPSAVAVVPAIVAKSRQDGEGKHAQRPVEQTREPEKDKGKSEEERVKEAAERINAFIESVSRDLEFSVDKDTNRTVVKVLARENGEVIRQIPAEEILKIAKVLDELKGLIIREKA
ncbi:MULTISPECIES: flagellar protein FlaG [Geobacter]|uniref:Flagellin n=2 Tax=Geobacter TaxID=28231 RepID=A0A0C1TVD5_9BACT|nr:MULTISPECIES: flagellar protein FlaG [Geobacter]ANA41209.1 flagellin [Geobacter anodireducens]KIE43353.1 flagellin [Geobacter soli]MBE2887742.1 flagellar protein FlaG [Geobacter anodireducens]